MESTINSTIKNYALGKSRAFVPRSTLELDFELGGISLQSIRHIREASDLLMVKEFLNGRKVWTNLLGTIIDKIYKNLLDII